MSCPDCFKGSIHTHAEPQGHYETLHGFRTYIAEPPSGKKQHTILYIPDAFGLKLVNNQLLADRYARETQCRVLIPDIIPGGGASVSSMEQLDVIMMPITSMGGYDPLEWIKKILAVLRVLVIFVPFFLTASPAKVYPRILKYTRDLRAGMGSGEKLGVCGFCWGGYGSVNMCGEASVAGGKERLVDVQFCAHPSGLTAPDMIVDALTRFGVPFSCAVPEKDMVFTLKSARETEAVLREKYGSPAEKNYEFVVHDGCTHSFAVRANPLNKVEYQGLEDAARQAINWFNRFLK